MAGEIAEDYWAGAYARCTVSVQYASDPVIAQAVADLSKFSDYRGPKVNGQVTAGRDFRGMTPGDLNGPYLSQFSAQDDPMGAVHLYLSSTKTAVPGDDYLTSYADWIKAAARRRQRIEYVRFHSPLHSQ